MKNLIRKLRKHPTHTVLAVCSHLLLIILIVYCIYMNLFNAFTPEAFSPQLPADSASSEPQPDFNKSAVSSTQMLKTLYQTGTRYVQCTVPVMYYTGYDCTNFGRTTGHYYYSLDDTSCTIYLISSKSLSGYDSTPVIISDYTFTARLNRSDTNIKSLLRYMSSDIDWNYYSLTQCTGSIVVDESEYSFTQIIVILISILVLAVLNIAQILNIRFL